MTQSLQSSKSTRDATGTLAQLNVSPGGMPKLPILAARVTVEGVPGDWQKDRRYHGGPDRAICLFSEELYNWLRADFSIDMTFGSVGENFTTCGIDLLALKPGDRLRVGECTIEITEVRIPCRNLKKWDERLPHVIEGHSGWVAKVVVEGDVKPGDAVEVVLR
ncbi:MAG: MOSC domain-containing protein [Anaerolineae bacterium]|nr:MOSC domain-containing protein [Phycisphaerae bacterium]